MKSIKCIILNAKTLVILLLLSLVQTVVSAQDGGADIDVKITKDSGDWYAQPWVWIIGGAVFILLLVALLRNNSNKS